MAFSTRVKAAVNRLLAPLNLRVETRTAERAEAARLRVLAARGHFSRAVFPVPPAFTQADPAPILEAARRYGDRLAALASADRNPVGFTLDNDYYSSPDAEVLYCVIREARPSRLVEVGSGHSTRIARLAIIDGGLATTLVSIDPHPRIDISGLADVVCAEPVESGAGRSQLAALAAGDILFIDSSHEIRPGNDVTTLCLQVLPALPSGVLVHVDDIFLPYDYPQAWIDAGWGWTEQYLVQALLDGTDRYEVLWPGHYFQRTRPEFASHFPQLGARMAKSLWLRVR
jgi:hypothetical protein